MSAKHYLLLGSALLVSACASQSTLQETADIADQFCLTNSQPNSEARRLLLSPSLARILHDTQIRTRGYSFEDVPAVTTEQTTTVTTTTVAVDDTLVPPVQTQKTVETIETAPTPAAPVPPQAICKPGRMFTVNGTRYAEIHHGMEDGSADWTDRLVLKNIDGRWTIDDILFAPDYRRSMRTTLVRAE